MESLQQRENTVEARRLKRKFTGALLALLITFLAVASATYAWYIYNTSQHTTNVRMAAGAGVNLQISRTPRHIEVVQCDKPVLHIGSGSPLLCGTK